MSMPEKMGGGGGDEALSEKNEKKQGLDPTFGRKELGSNVVIEWGDGVLYNINRKKYGRSTGRKFSIFQFLIFTSSTVIGPVTASSSLSSSDKPFRFPSKNRPAFHSLFAKNLSHQIMSHRFISQK